MADALEDLESEGRPLFLAPKANRELQRELHRELEELQELWKRTHGRRWRRPERSSAAQAGPPPNVVMVMAATAAAIFSKLGKRAGEGTANLPRKVRDLLRDPVRKKGKPDELFIGTKEGRI